MALQNNPLLSPTDDLTGLLAPGEEVVWRGKPELVPFVFRTWPLSIFGVVLLVAAVTFEAIVLTGDAPDALALYGVPFVLAAIYMVAGHFAVSYREWLNTEYLVTGRRVLIRHGIFSPSVKEYSLLGMPQTSVEMQGEGVGNLMFTPPRGEGYGPWPGYRNMWPYTPGYLVGMLYIQNPADVQRVIESARRRGG